MSQAKRQSKGPRVPVTTPDRKHHRVGASRSALWRVGEIHRIITAGRYPNCATLAREIEVSPKTIQRDIDYMRDQKGMPLEYDAVRHGYHYTRPVSEFPALQLTRGELVALFVARKALEPLRGTRLERLLAESVNKIAEACPGDVTFHWHELDEAFSVKVAGVLPADVVLFNDLLEAVMDGREVSFGYHTLKGAGHELRRVQPYHVNQTEHGWYLIAHDLARGEIRTFALQRIRDLEVLKARFSRPAGFNARDHLSSGFGVWSYEAAGTHRHEVRVRFEGYAARVVAERHWHRTQSIERLNADGSVIEFSVEIAGLDEITRWILSWGSTARVIAPPELRERVCAETEKMRENYKCDRSRP